MIQSHESILISTSLIVKNRTTYEDTFLVRYFYVTTVRVLHSGAVCPLIPGHPKLVHEAFETARFRPFGVLGRGFWVTWRVWLRGQAFHRGKLNNFLKFRVLPV
jgi:hypothetical protein